MGFEIILFWSMVERPKNEKEQRELIHLLVIADHVTTLKWLCQMLSCIEYG
jgi:hypothetical protein